MPHYAVRITHSYEACQRVVGLWALRSDRIAVFEHEGEKTGKTHIHLALFGTSVDKKQLRNIAAATGLNVKGNENCSFKEWDGKPDNYMYYMTKGKYDASYIKWYTIDDVNEWKRLWVPPKDYETQNHWQKLYYEFSETGHCVMDPDDPDAFNTLHYLAHRFVKYKLKNRCPQWKSYMNCVVMSYADDHPQITVPKDYRYNY